jgi:hypothetical protein
VSFTSNQDIRFRDNVNFTDPTWWRRVPANSSNYFRTVIANGITVSLINPTAQPSGFGGISLDLSGFATQYADLKELEFRVERKEEGGSWEPAGAPFRRSLDLDREITWYDINTPLNKNLWYRLSYRKVGGGGYICIEDAVVGPVISQGSAIADEEPPQIQVFQVESGNFPVTQRWVGVELVVSDNRTPAPDLQVQFEVNGQKLYYDGAGFSSGDDWGQYLPAYTGLDLGTVNGLVKVTVRVKDAVGNIGTSQLTVDLQIPAGYSQSGAVQVQGGTAGTYNGRQAVFVNSDQIVLNLDFTGAAQMRFSFDGQASSSWEPYNEARVLTLPKSSGVLTLVVEAKNDAGVYFDPGKITLVVDSVPPVIHTLRGYNQATATKTGSVTLAIQASDNLPGPLQYQYQVDDGPLSGWSLLAGNTINVSGLTNGLNTITVQVKDNAGNTASAAVSIWRI